MTKYQGTEEQHELAHWYMEKSEMPAAAAYARVHEEHRGYGLVTSRDIAEVARPTADFLEKLASSLISEIRATGSSRELSLAVTKVQEAMFWASQHQVAS
jgi:hypothetical protein